ncbi:universal stress protein [Rhodoferax sp.]|uniref:universal stress protein n=1 Tax=Rhodoferax sp. TaxID=50421 RepID=UPI002ACDDE35|nr:universal stress protein [Rhodoferax sp.]MDZ7919486.1 universal stress protein [Rhodoferax sp.]
MKVLLAVDGSSYSKKMLAYLATHDALLSTDHDYTVFTAQPALPANARAALGKEVVEGYYQDESAKVLGPVLEFLQRHAITAKSSSKVGPAGPALAKLAEQGRFDLVVLGSHGHSALGNLVMGSVATQVLAECKVPALLVR